MHYQKWPFRGTINHYIDTKKSSGMRVAGSHPNVHVEKSMMLFSYTCVYTLGSYHYNIITYTVLITYDLRIDVRKGFAREAERREVSKHSQDICQATFEMGSRGISPRFGPNTASPKENQAATCRKTWSLLLDEQWIHIIKSSLHMFLDRQW